MHIYLQSAPFEVQCGILAMAKIQELCALVEEESTRLDLIHILRLTNDFRVSDPRDKVIGILGLVRFPPTMARFHFLVDYSLTVDETYHRLALHLVETGMTSEMLTHAGLHRRSRVSTHAPSWIPDWMAQSRDFGPQPLVLFRPQLYRTATSKRFCCKLIGVDRNRSDLLDTINMRTLVVMGGAIDELACLSQARPCYVGDVEGPVEHMLTELMDWMLSTRTCIEDAYRKMEFQHLFSLEAFVRTLFVDDTYVGENATLDSSPITNVEDCYTKACFLFQQGAQNTVQFRLPRKITPEQTLLRQVMAASAGKRIALSKKGQFCLVPACSQIGDRITVLLGANVPYILRPAYENPAEVVLEGRLKGRLIGDAYVHGIMDGEALQFKDFKETEIHIW
jgi:hypothetical protein